MDTGNKPVPGLALPSPGALSTQVGAAGEEASEIAVAVLSTEAVEDITELPPEEKTYPIAYSPASEEDVIPYGVEAIEAKSQTLWLGDVGDDRAGPSSQDAAPAASAPSSQDAALATIAPLSQDAALAA